MNSPIINELSSIVGTEYNPLFHDFYIEQVAFNLNVSEQAVIDDLKNWYEFYKTELTLNKIGSAFNSNNQISTKKRLSFVYLAKCRVDSNLYKIGISSNPDSRIRSMNRVHPSVSIELIHSFESDNAERIEKILHNQFISKRVSTTEWFRLDESDVEYLMNINGYFGGEIINEW